jgi:endonuclease YncB( thermonuclease family)
MMTLRTTIVVTLFAAPALALPKGPVSVIRVVDGDTIHVGNGDDDYTIRILGIDCPESRKVKKCGKYREGLSCKEEIVLGKAATRQAEKLLDGATVTLEGAKGKDVFRRELAYVRLSDGRDYGLTMIKNGMCSDFGWKYPHARGQAYQQAQNRTR